MKFKSLALLLVLSVTAPLRAESQQEPPVPVRTVPPVYPNQLRRDGIAGVVTISCVVDEQGNVQNPVVEKSTNDGFNDAAVEALKKWKFKPAKIDGAPVAKKIMIPLKFSVQET